MRAGHDLARAAERAAVLALIACGAALIVVPLALTVYLSLFDEKLILFPPRGYTLDWYSAIVPNFGRPALTSLRLAALSVAGSLALGIPAGIALSRHRFRGRGAIATLLLAPLTMPGIALGLAIFVALVAIDERLGSALTGNLGVSFRNGDPVTLTLLERLPATVSLAVVGIIIALLIALPAGIWSALHEGRVSDAIVRITSQFGVSIPDFWMGILLIGLFASTLHWLPTSGYRPLFEDPAG